MDERRRPQPPRLLRWVLPLTLIVLYVPLAVMILSSFSETTESGPSLTLRWYIEVFQDPDLLEALGRSFIVGVGSAAGSTLIGLLGAFALNKWAFKGRPILQVMSLVSLMLPELVLALSLLSWFALTGVELSLVTVIIAHITLTLPFVVLIISARLRDLESSIEDAARDLGAREWQVVARVTLPLLKPAVATAFLLAFLLSFDDFLVTFYTNGAGQDTLPVRLYSLMKTGLTPKLQALSSLMLILSIALVMGLVHRRAVETGNDRA